jgi:hypothetical protein
MPTVNVVLLVLVIVGADGVEGGCNPKMIVCQPSDEGEIEY